MKYRWFELLLALLLSFGAPFLILNMAKGTSKKEAFSIDTHTSSADETITLETTCTERSEAFVIKVLNNNKVMDMELEEYLKGVVLGEMPGSFPMEAKKAQAVVARTYTLRSLKSGKHEGGYICTDPGCCQSYTDPEAFVSGGGELWIAEEAGVAVEQTAGQVLTYRGDLIEATYFSCSGGMTEAAVEVWGNDVPYLQSVESPGEENAEHFEDAVRYDREQLEQKLDVTLSEAPKEWIGEIRYTNANSVSLIQFGEKRFSGTQIRKLLGLRSTSFRIQIFEKDILIITRGFGHRVGMSQYGARAMAINGQSYAEILTHYYEGVELTTIKG